MEAEHINYVGFEKQASSVEVRGTHHKHCPKAYPDASNASLKLEKTEFLFFVTIILLRILRVSWCPLDRLSARRRVSLVVGLPP
jgi:hypothetical protein